MGQANTMIFNSRFVCLFKSEGDIRTFQNIYHDFDILLTVFGVQVKAFHKYHLSEVLY